MNDTETTAGVNPPRPTGTVFTVNLTGALFPWHDDPPRPALLRVAGDDSLSLPVFSSEEALRGLMARLGLTFDRIKAVVDADDFLDSLRALNVPNLRVITDPYFTAEGKVRYGLVNPFAPDVFAPPLRNPAPGYGSTNGRKRP